MLIIILLIIMIIIIMIINDDVNKDLNFSCSTRACSPEIRIIKNCLYKSKSYVNQLNFMNLKITIMSKNCNYP